MSAWARATRACWGGDLTDPEDKLAPPDKDSAGDLPEGDLIPKNATWVKMACWPANGPDRPAHQRHPYQSWQHSPACGIFMNTPATMKWYVGFKDGGYGGPSRIAPYFVAIQLKDAFVLTHFTITPSPEMPNRDPMEWAIQGSNTGAEKDWTDIYVCDAKDRTASPFQKGSRCETFLFTSFTSADMAKAVRPDDARKIAARLNGTKIDAADFARPAKAYTWFRVIVYACFNPSSSSVSNPAAPPGCALSQLELFGAPGGKEVAASTADSREAPVISIVPEPRKVQLQPGRFTLKADTAIVCDRPSRAAAEWLSARLAAATGYSLAIREGAPGEPNTVALAVAPSATLGEEGYELTVTPAGTSVRGGGSAGVFYACQTIRQLLPPQIESPQKVPDVEWAMPCVTIEDQPRFAWRGCLIDEARNFLGKDVLKRQIDLMAFHKLNRLHWHLTDDQGWRIEIKKYPKLTEVGAWRGAAKTGGFYTQDEIREIVKYAQSRHVTIVPEIEMPGHAQAALASYPSLGCRGQGYAVGTAWGVYDDVYCPGNDEIFPFLENVLTEVMGLFPGPYIHIGADEVPKDRWQACPKCQARMKANSLKTEHELQGWFVRHFDEFLRKHNRRLIGWDEILDGGLAPTAVVQAWHGMDDGIRSAAGGHDTIMSPTTDCYFDYGYDAIPLPRVYHYDPIASELTAEGCRHVLGIEGNLWGENIPNSDRLDFQGFPRLCALAEIAWSPLEARSWEGFASRMTAQYTRLDLLGVKYNPAAKAFSWGRKAGRWEPGQVVAQFKPVDWNVTKSITAPGAYEATFVYRAGRHAVNIEWAALLENGKELTRDTHAGYSGFDKTNITYRLAVPAVKPQAEYVLRASLKGTGGTDSAGDVLILPPGKPEATTTKP